MSINKAKKAKAYEENGKTIVECPSCGYAFEKAQRCPECGQLIDYGDAEYKSELRAGLSLEIFQNAFESFMRQAESNAESKKSQGSKVPAGFLEKPLFDGAHFMQHFGQGAASKSPYINWWVVSIYYLVDSGRIIMGIEKDRYPHIKEMSPKSFIPVGNKSTSVATFYETSKSSIDYAELYDKFLTVSEEVMKLGLE